MTAPIHPRIRKAAERIAGGLPLIDSKEGG